MKKDVKIAFFDAKPYDITSFDEVNNDFGFEIKYIASKLNADTAIMAKNFNIVCAFVNDEINSFVINELYGYGVKLIAMRSAGYNNVDMRAAYEKIHVVRVPAYSPYAVAEHTVALMLSLNRKIHRAYYRTHDHNFSINGFLGFDMYGKTAGIIGTGKIGKILANILLGFGMRVLVYDLYPDTDFARETGVEYTELDELFAKSDIVSLHCPLTPDTHHIINAKSIASMKDDVMIINTSRGGLIDTPALIDALKSKKIGSAGLDVYEEEGDYFFEDFSSEVLDDDILARLLSFPNVLITSHQAFFTKEALGNIANTTLENITEFIEGKPLTNEICYQCEADPCKKKTSGHCF
jgi:D-lactate dehydrogenase